MSNIDNHMDELFQKAAENYPLRTGSGNFDTLMPFLPGKPVATVSRPAAKGKRKTTLLLLVLLITGATIGTYLINSSSNKTTTAKVPVMDAINSLAKNKTAQQINIDAPIADYAASENIFPKNKLNALNKEKIFILITQGLAVTEDVTLAANDLAVNNEATSTKIIAVTTDQKQTNGDDLKSKKKKETVKEETKPAYKNDTKKNNKLSLYYGVTGGAELNMVKTQAPTKPGLNGGILLGLQFTKNLSAETGIQLSQKKYYSEGKYFKPKAGTMPANMVITSLEGTSTLIEIPISVKYNFSKKKNTFYGKAGLSSYIITKESNKYQTVVSGQQQEINSTYKDAHSYLASEVRISAGYQHTINKKINIRVEPYIQIPLKGIGIGNMPVTSAGLQLVLTRN